MTEKATGITPSQTVGPFFKYGLTPNRQYNWNDAFTADLVTSDASGERIRVEGTVYDGDGAPVPDCMLEVWQADAQGHFADPQDTRALQNTKFRGFGRVFTDAAGRYRFVSIKPGAYPWRNHPNAWRPNHIHFSLFGAAWGSRLVTQMYFPGDPLLAYDPIAHAVRDETVRRRMISSFDLDLTEEGWALGYRWDIVVGGRLATPMEP